MVFDACAAREARLTMRLHVPGFARRSKIGVDLGDDAIRLVQMDQRGHRVLAAALLQRPAFDDGGLRDRSNLDFKQQLKRALRRGRFVGSQCVIGAPRELVHVHPVRVPQMPAKELEASLAWESEDRFGIPREHLQVDGVVTGARSTSVDDDRTEVVVFAMDTREAEPWLAPLLAAGLAPVAMEPGFSAVARAHCRRVRREQDRERTRVVLDMGYAGTTLLFMRGDRIGFVKTFEIGGAALDKALAESIGMDVQAAAALRRDRRHAARGARQLDTTADAGVADAAKPLLHELAGAVGLCLRHCAVSFRGNRPECLILSGREGDEPGLQAMLEERCGIEITTDDESETLSTLARDLAAFGLDDEDPGAWAAAMGLAIRPARAASISRASGKGHAA